LGEWVILAVLPAQSGFPATAHNPILDSTSSKPTPQPLHFNPLHPEPRNEILNR